MNDPTRRSVLRVAAAAACACAGCAVRTGAAPSRTPSPVDVGPLADFARDGITSRWAADHGFFVVSRGGRVFAVSSHCTHKNVQLVVSGDDNGFKCPRHGSAFGADGGVTKAPARKSLPRFGVRVNDAGRVVVDPAVQFARADWGAEGSYISVNARAAHEDSSR
jgi:nitrite reductase/ring-hydroxylating ferredoxin subunit